MKKLLIVLIILNLHCSLVNKYVTKHGGIFGRAKIIAEEDSVKKNRILKEISLKIKGTDIYPEKDEAGFFWFNGLKPGTYTIEYVHPEYEMHELRNIEVISDKYTMAVCWLRPKRFKERDNDNYRYNEWDKKGEEYGILPYSLNPEERGSLELHMKEPLDKGNINIIAESYYSNGNRIGQSTVWSTSESGKIIKIENMLPGRYDIRVISMKYHLTHLIDVIIKEKYEAILDVPLVLNWYALGPFPIKAEPIYKKLK